MFAFYQLLKLKWSNAAKKLSVNKNKKAGERDKEGKNCKITQTCKKYFSLGDMCALTFGISLNKDFYYSEYKDHHKDSCNFSLSPSLRNIYLMRRYAKS